MIILIVFIVLIVIFFLIFKYDYLIKQKTNNNLNAEVISTIFVIICAVFNWFFIGTLFSHSYIFGPINGMMGDGISGLSIIITLAPPLIIIGLGYFIDWMRIELYVGKEADKRTSKMIKEKNEKK